MDARGEAADDPAPAADDSFSRERDRVDREEVSTPHRSGHELSMSEFTHISEPLGEVMKEIRRRVELRQRLEIERGQLISDREFLEIAERTGMRI